MMKKPLSSSSTGNADAPNNTDKTSTAKNSTSSKDEEERTQPQKQNKMTPEKMQLIGMWLNGLYVVATIIIAFMTWLALSETRKSNKTISEQFELENTPYLTITKIDVAKYNALEQIEVQYEINNLGKHPVQVISIKSSFTIMPKTVPMAGNELTNFKASMVETPLKSYVMNQSPFVGHYFTPKAITQDGINMLEKGETTVYMVGELSYVNLINNKQRKYTFFVNFRTFTLAKNDVIFIENDNVDIPTEKPKVTKDFSVIQP